MARIPAPALCPDIHSHTASCCCSPLAALSRPKELTAALCMHIYLSFKQRDTQKIVSNSMRTNILNPDAFTELLHLSDMLDQNCLFSTVTWLLLPDILYFCHYCAWLRLKQTRNKLWTKRHHSKHCLFKASSLQSSSEQAIHLSPPWSTPLWTWPILQDPVCRQYTPVQLISAHHFYQQFQSLSFVVWERTTVASKLVHSPKDASFKQLWLFFHRRDQCDFNAEAKEKKTPFCCNFTSKYRKYSYRNTKKPRWGERWNLSYSSSSK